MNHSSRSKILALALLSSMAVSVRAAESASAADHPATVISTVSPTYPYLMRHAGATADVTLLFTVNSKGAVTKASVIDSTNYEFNAAALDAIKKWTFMPATRNGEAVEKKLRLTFRFTLRDEATAADAFVAGLGAGSR